jgi:hypothetical protein
VNEELLEHCFAIQDGLQKRRIGKMGERVIDVLTKLSYHAGRTTAPVARLDELAEAAMIHRGNLRRVLDELINAEILDEQVHGDWLVYEIRPDWQQWRLPLRNRLEDEAKATAALKRMLAAATNDPEQMTLRIPDAVRDKTEMSRAFTPVVRRTTELEKSADSVVRGTSESVVHGTSPPVVHGTTPSCEGSVVRSTTASPFKAIKALEVKSVNAPKALGAEGAARFEPGEEEPERTSGMDPDHALLLERMWRVIPDQRETYAGAWLNRASSIPRAMRLAVDRYLESPPQKLRTTTWQWLRAEYIANAYKLGLQDKLSEQDQLRRGWWTKLKHVVHLA